MKGINNIKKTKKITLKSIFDKIKKILLDNKLIIFMALPFLLMELFIFIFGLKISYFNYRFYSVILFDICWLLLFIGLSLCFKKIIGKIIYLLSVIIFLVMYIVNGV